MSMMDSFFSRGFKGSKCKTALKLTIPRIKLLRNRREVQLKQMRKEIVQLLQTGQEATARIRVEHIFREQNIMSAYEIIELFCELVVVRLPIIESQRECPLDLKEAISSLCFAAPRCSDLPELIQVQQMFSSKYGREFVMAASELRPDCGVNRQIIEKLSVRAPTAEMKLKLMKEIAEEHELEWDSSNTEAEFFKLHEDLLNGPTHFLSGLKMPIPDEKDKSQSPSKHSSKDSDSDKDFDDLELPEVPKQPDVQIAAEVVEGTVPQVPSVPTQTESERSSYTSGHGSVPHLSPLVSNVSVVNIESPVGSPTSPPNRSDNMHQKKQFVPFISSPPPPKTPEKVATYKEEEARIESEERIDLQAVLAATKAAKTAAEAAAQASVARKQNENRMDWQDVLAAAKAAAESADRAASDARAAAAHARVKISELSSKMGSENFDEACISDDEQDKMFYSSKNVTSDSSVPQDIQPEQISENGQRKDDIFDLNLERVKSGIKDGIDLDGYNRNTVHIGSIPPPPGHPDRKVPVGPKISGEPIFDSPSQVPSSIHEAVLHHESSEQPQRLNSMEDDDYYTYPNIFSSQNSFSQQDHSQTFNNPTNNTRFTT